MKIWKIVVCNFEKCMSTVLFAILAFRQRKKNFAHLSIQKLASVARIPGLILKLFPDF